MRWVSLTVSAYSSDSIHRIGAVNASTGNQETQNNAAVRTTVMIPCRFIPAFSLRATRLAMTNNKFTDEATMTMHIGRKTRGTIKVGSKYFQTLEEKEQAQVL